MIEPIKRLVRVIEREGRLFRLSAHSSARRLYKVRTRWPWGNVWKFVTTSQIEWTFGRQPADPTNEVIFRHDPTEGVFFKVSFCVAGVAATCPGVVVTLAVRDHTSTHPRGDWAVRIDRLFSQMIAILRPDHGCVRLTGQPDVGYGSREPQAGWLTYLATPETSRPLPSPAVVTPLLGGVKVVAMAGTMPGEHAGGADAIAAVQAAIAPPAGSHPGPAGVSEDGTGDPPTR